MEKLQKSYKDIRLKQGSDDWKQWRYNTGIGGSEIASVLATDSFELSQLVYTAPIKLFLQKIGEPVQAFTGNISSEEGKFQERAIVERFKYYDLERPDAMLMHKNRQMKNVLNRVLRPNCVFHNPKWEWMFYSPDALWCRPEEKRLIRHGLLESKLSNSMECNRYKNRVNPSHYLQVMYGLKITGLSIGYVLLLVDGQFFEPVPVYPDAEVFQWIEEISAQFWLKVVKARQLKIEYGIPCYFGVNPDSLTERQREGVELITSLEPELIGSGHELKFIREMITPQAEEVARDGSDDERELAIQYLGAGEDMKKLDAGKKIILSEMLMKLNGSNVINFGDAGYYSYKPDKNGNPSIYVSPKLRQI